MLDRRTRREDGQQDEANGGVTVAGAQCVHVRVRDFSCLCACLCVCACELCVRVCARVCGLVRVRAKRAVTHACSCVFACACLCARVRACVRTCASALASARAKRAATNCFHVEGADLAARSRTLDPISFKGSGLRT